MLWLAPIPIGLFTGHLHFTWGNLSFHPEAKRWLVFKAVILWGLLFAVHSMIRNTSIRSSVTTLMLMIYLVTLTWSIGPDMLLTGVTGAWLGIAAAWLPGGAGPATLIAVVWITLTGVLPLADGPFDGIGMIVTSQTMKVIQFIVWPAAMIFVLLITRILRRPK